MIKLDALSNSDLLDLLRSGEHGAFEEIYTRYWKILYAIAYNRLRDRQKSEDVIHDVLSALWNNRHTSEINNLNAYLATAVKFRVLETIRKESHKQAFIEQTSQAELQESHDLAEALHRKRLLQALHEEVEKLPEKCRLVFKYSREQNMPIKQIALEMDLSTSTVENHLNRALKRLREIVKQMGGQILLMIFLLAASLL